MTSDEDELLVTLTRMTLGYDQPQDRIRVDGLASGGTSIRMWITQRLVRRLIAHFVDAGYHMPPQGKVRIHSEINVEEEPVIYSSCDPEWLVQSIDITPRQDDIVFLFKGAADASKIIFCLPNASIGSWLVGFKRCFDVADWPIISLGSNVSSESELESITVH